LGRFDERDRRNRTYNVKEIESESFSGELKTKNEKSKNRKTDKQVPLLLATVRWGKTVLLSSLCCMHCSM
jgi:hypothetical protein